MEGNKTGAPQALFTRTWLFFPLLLWTQFLLTCRRLLLKSEVMLLQKQEKRSAWPSRDLRPGLRNKKQTDINVWDRALTQGDPTMLSLEDVLKNAKFGAITLPVM